MQSLKIPSLSAESPTLLRFTTGVALLIAIIIAVFPPILHFAYGVKFEKGQMKAEAKLYARDVSQLVGRNPEMWQFETMRIDEVISAMHKNDIGKAPLHGDIEGNIVVLNAEGEIVTQSSNRDLPEPQISVSQPLYDAGTQVGTLVETRSIIGVVTSTGWLFVATTLIALFAFFLRTFPLKLLSNAIEKASFLASHDSLTKLPNRSLFNESLSLSLDDVERQKSSLAVLYLDLDHFKEVNDLLGHAAGDELLRQATQRMTSSLRSNDILARLGGDEFSIIQKHMEQPHGSSMLAARLVSSLSEPFDLDGNKVNIGVSIGIALHNAGDAIDGETLMRHADLALYRVKVNGRGSFRYFENDMNDALVARKKIEASLRMAIADNELELYYQPQIDLKTNTIKGVEALLRWNHKTDGQISPDKFIPLAEESGLIIPIGDWVIRQACRQAKEWPDLTFAINVSPVQFRQGDLVSTVRNALQAEGVDPSRLEIEITEGVLLSHTEETISVLSGLQKMGVKIAMDDFGTGYSSLSYLRRFPFDKIKIDKSFISDLGTCADADSIVDAVIRLGTSMGMTTNAEGIETLEQANLLRGQGCQEVQGFYFSKPLPAALISELLADRKWESLENVAVIAPLGARQA